jgi:hypothetical protein
MGINKQETSMYATLKTALAAAIVLGSASFALADDGTSRDLDTSRYGIAVQGSTFKSSNASLSQVLIVYRDHAGARHDNGGN